MFTYLQLLEAALRRLDPSAHFDLVARQKLKEVQELHTVLKFCGKIADVDLALAEMLVAFGFNE